MELDGTVADFRVDVGKACLLCLWDRILRERAIRPQTRQTGPRETQLNLNTNRIALKPVNN